MTYITPPTLSAGMTVKASHWNTLVADLDYLDERVTTLEAAGTVPPDYSAFPINAIVAYSGGSATLPSGWYVCNGSTVSGTVLPDLRAKFIYGGSEDTDLAVTGGGTAHTHTSGNTSEAGDHRHSVSATTGGPSATYGAGSGATSAASPSHVHSLNATTQSAGSHSHTVGTSGSGDNLPPYIKLYYITRLA